MAAVNQNRAVEASLLTPPAFTRPLISSAMKFIKPTKSLAIFAAILAPSASLSAAPVQDSITSPAACGCNGETLVMEVIQPSMAGDCGSPGLSFDLNVLLTGQVNALTDSVASLEEEKVALAAANAEMEAMMAELRKQSEMAAQQIAELRKEAEAAKLAMSELEKKADELVAAKEALAKLETEKGSLTQLVADKDKMLAEKESQLTEKDKSIATMREEIESLSASTLASKSEESKPSEDAPADPPTARKEGDQEPQPEVPAEEPETEA
jgi:hypothetical protein